MFKTFVHLLKLAAIQLLQPLHLPHTSLDLKRWRVSASNLPSVHIEHTIVFLFWNKWLTCPGKPSFLLIRSSLDLRQDTLRWQHPWSRIPRLSNRRNPKRSSQCRRSSWLWCLSGNENGRSSLMGSDILNTETSAIKTCKNEWNANTL